MICPMSKYCPDYQRCMRVGCLHVPNPLPVYRIAEPTPCLHFVGFRGEEYWSAVKVWGFPDFYHRGWDTRAAREIANGVKGRIAPF